jgi:F0F1-type ATP synthase membrane subunit c/vacuolar-type H+-ATPase subunit K
MLVSVLLYFVVVRMSRPEHPTDDPGLVRTLLVIALGFTVASFLARNRFETRARDNKMPALGRVGLLLALALCEAAALLGVVVWFVTASPLYYWFLLMGIAGILLHYPKPVG